MKIKNDKKRMPIKFFGRRKEFQKQPIKSGESDSTLNKGTIKIAKAGTYQALAAPIYFIIYSISILYVIVVTWP